MLQIKTIRRADPCEFDEAVNSALLEGWTLTRRLTGPDHFVAEMEREVETENEECYKTYDDKWARKRCANCEHYGVCTSDPPCSECRDFDQWEALEG